MADKPALTIQAPRPIPRKAVRKYALCDCKSSGKHLHEIDAEGKLKTDGATIYSDTAPDDNRLDYGENGLTCKRTFKIDGVEIMGIYGEGTLWDGSYNDASIPWRGDLHPYITAGDLGLPTNVVFAVNNVSVMPLSSTQIQVICDYGFLNAVNQ